jgi:hypothetical protein
MIYRGFLGSAVVIAFLFATDGKAQKHSDEPVFRPELDKLGNGALQQMA